MTIGSSLPPRIPESTGTIFYVGGSGASDANPGTSSLPWATIQKASNTLQDNQKALVRSGTYTEIVTLRARTPGTQTATIEADVGATVQLVGTILFFDATYWRVRNIEIIGGTTGGAGSSANQGIAVFKNSVGTKHNEVYGCSVHDVKYTIAQTVNPEGLFIQDASLVDFQVWNSKFWRNGRRGTTTGQIVSGAVTIPVDSTLDLPASGTLWLPDHTTCAYTGTTGGNTLTGVTGITKTWAIGTVLFAKGNTGTAILDHGGYIDTTPGTGSPDVLLANCLWYDNLAFGLQVYPLAKAVWVVNNVFAYNFNQGGITLSQNGANGTTGCLVENCISYHNDDGAQDHSGTSGFDIHFLTAGDTPLNHIDTAIGYQNGNAATGFNFIADTAGVVSTNKIESDPLFVANGTDVTTRNFALQAASPAKAAGIAAYTPPTDFAGAVRATAEIGAYALPPLGRHGLAPNEAPSLSPTILPNRRG